MIIVDDIPMEWEEGLTVADLVKAKGLANQCAVVRLNGKLVSSPNFTATQIPDKAEVRLLPLVAGG